MSDADLPQADDAGQDDTPAHFDTGDPIDYRKAWVDIGTDLVKNSLSVSLDFCKTMASTAITLLGVYYALGAFVFSKDFVVKGDVTIRGRDISANTLALIPPVFLLAAVVFFVIAIVPRRMSIDLSVIEGGDTSIKSVRESAVKWRAIFGYLGTAVMIIGLLFIAPVVWNLDRANENQPSEPASAQYAIVIRSDETVACGQLTLDLDGQAVALVTSAGSAPETISTAKQIQLVKACSAATPAPEQ